MQRIMQRNLYECLLKSDYQGKFSQIKAAILHVKYCPEQKYKLIYVKDLRICLCYSICLRDLTRHSKEMLRKAAVEGVQIDPNVCCLHTERFLKYQTCRVDIQVEQA